MSEDVAYLRGVLEGLQRSIDTQFEATREELREFRRDMADLGVSVSKVSTKVSTLEDSVESLEKTVRNGNTHGNGGNGGGEAGAGGGAAADDRKDWEAIRRVWNLAKKNKIVTVLGSLVVAGLAVLGLWAYTKAPAVIPRELLPAAAPAVSPSPEPDGPHAHRIETGRDGTLRVVSNWTPTPRSAIAPVSRRPDHQ